MQRNIFNKILVCGILLLLVSAPISRLCAAENALETTTNLDESISGTYYVNAQHGLKMRSAPSTDAEVVTLLPYKTEITVTGAVTDNWYQAEYSNHSGYVAANYLTKSAAANTDTAPADTTTTETPESTLPSEESRSDTFGTTNVITALIAAIVIMVILAIYTAYSFLKKGSSSETEEYEDDYDEEEYDNEYQNGDDGDDNTGYGDDDREYNDEYDDDDTES